MKSAILKAHKTAVEQDKKLIADILNKPPFDMMDISIINFLRHSMATGEGNQFDVTFKDADDTPLFSAQITTGHSPLDLRVASITAALNAYHDLDKNAPAWDTAHVAPYFNITAQEYKEFIAEQPFHQALLSAQRMQASPVETLRILLDVLNQGDKEHQVAITKPVLENMFTALHASILHAETSCALQDTNGQALEKPSRGIRKPSWLTRFMP